MASALESLDKSISHFVSNDFGLKTSADYEKRVDGELLKDINVVRQFVGGYKQRKIINGKQIDYEVFLITLPFLPTKNDKLHKDNSIYYVDTFEIISANNYRIYCESNIESVPSPTKGIEL